MSVRDEPMEVLVDNDAIRVVSVGVPGPAGPASLAAGDVITGEGEVPIGGPGGTVLSERFNGLVDARYDADTQIVGGPTDATPVFFPVSWINGYSRGMDPDAADNSGAIQDLIDKVMESALEPTYGAMIPPGEFHITSDIEIPFCVGLKLGGMSSYSSRIIQDSTSTPILNFKTDPNSHTIRVSDLYLGWDTQQTSSDTSSAAIWLNGDGNAQPFSLLFERLRFFQGFRGIYSHNTGDNVPFNMTINHLVASRFTGAAIHSADSAGKPNWRIDDVYVTNSGTALSASEAAIRLEGVQELLINRLSIETWSNIHLELGGTTVPALIDGYHMEGSTVGDPHAVINQINNSGFIARNVSAQLTLTQTAEPTYLFACYGNAGAVAEISGMDTAITNSGGQPVYPLRLGAGVTGYLRGIVGSGMTSTSIDPTHADSVAGLREVNGDFYQHPYYTYADYAATRDDTIILLDTFPAVRTVTLPPAAGYIGKVYTIKRVSAANDAIVQADGSELIDGNNTRTITTNNGFITIVSDGANWKIIGSGGTIT